MSRRLTIQIVDKIASLVGDVTTIVCGNSDYEVEFLFDSEWGQRPVKTAMFVVNGEAIPQVFEGTVCKVPVIENTLMVEVGVFAGTVNDGTLSTSTPALIECKKCVTSDTEISPPTDDVYKQITGLCEEAVNTANDVKERADNGEFDGKDGIGDGIKTATGHYIGTGECRVCGDFDLIGYPGEVNRLSFDFVPLSLEVFGDKRCTFRFEDTGEYFLPNVDVNHIRNITPDIDGLIEGAWGEPQKVTNITNGLKPTISTWAAFDDKNIYYAYRCEISSATFGTGLKAIVFIDKANDGTVGSEQGTGSNHDRIGWWYYANESTGRGQWQDYNNSWSAPYLSKNDREMMSYVKKVNNKYIFEGELRIARSTAPYIDEAISSGKTGQMPIRIGFVNNGVEYWSASVPGAVIPDKSHFLRELKYDAFSVEEGVVGRTELSNRLMCDFETGKCDLYWATAKGEESSAVNQLNEENTKYYYVAWGVDAETLYKKNGW